MDFSINYLLLLLLLLSNISNNNKIGQQNKLQNKIWQMRKFATSSVHSDHHPDSYQLSGFQYIKIIDFKNKKIFSTFIDTTLYGYRECFNIDTLYNKIKKEDIRSSYLDTLIEDSTTYNLIFLKSELVEWIEKSNEKNTNSYILTDDDSLKINNINHYKIELLTDKELILSISSDNKYGKSKILIEFNLLQSKNINDINKKIKNYRGVTVPSLFFKFLYPYFKKLKPNKFY